MLVAGIFDPTGDDRLVRELEGTLEIHQPRDRARRSCWPTLMRGKEARPLPFEEIPVDECRKLHQFMAGIDDVAQPPAEQVISFRDAEMELHRRPEIAGFLAKAYETLQCEARRGEARKTATSSRKINAFRVIQTGLTMKLKP